MSLPSLLLLHAGQTVSWTSWTIHWSTVIGLAGLGALYAWRLRAVRSGTGVEGRGSATLRETSSAPRAAEPRPATPALVPVAASPARPLAFAAALVAVFLSLNGPLHDLSDTFLFSAH